MSFVGLENNGYIAFNAWTSSALELKYLRLFHVSPLVLFATHLTRPAGKRLRTKQVPNLSPTNRFVPQELPK
jgi:hypothetical protein